MRGGGPNDVQYEMKMEDFENLQDQIAKLDDAQEIDERHTGDHVPQQFKDEFNLPKDMKLLTIDFNEVRSTDS